MPRPDDLDLEWIRLCTQEFDADTTLPSFVRIGPMREVMLEVWLAGVRLNEGLRADGADEDMVSRIGFAHGQRCFGKRDPWRVTDQVLEEFKAGYFTPPGEELANALLTRQPLQAMKIGGAK